MRLIKISALMLFSAITLLFLYANVRQVSPSEKLEPVSLAIFQLDGDFSGSPPDVLEQKLKETTGVTACRVNYEGKVASVIYQTKQADVQTLQNRFASAGKLTASLKTFEATGGGCPVHGIGNAFTKFISALDLR